MIFTLSSSPNATQTLTPPSPPLTTTGGHHELLLLVAEPPTAPSRDLKMNSFRKLLAEPHYTHLVLTREYFELN